MKQAFVNYIRNLQDTITQTLEKIDGKATFKEDPCSEHKNINYAKIEIAESNFSSK